MHYNIGFFDFSEQVLLGNVSIHWMKHCYQDRFFADPFILDISKDEIYVLVEELFYKDWRGRITLLTVDRDTYLLKQRKVLLDLDTHLSFPFIYRTDMGIYVIPENSASGVLNAYQFDENNEKLVWKSTLVEQPVIDPIIIQRDNQYLLFGSLPGKKEHENLFVWQSLDLLKGYKRVVQKPLIVDRPDCARRGGDFFTFNNVLYSAVQSCVYSYGEALRLCRVNKISSTDLDEEEVAVLYPDQSYPNGLHTFNCYKGMCVVDGLTYWFDPIRKIISVINRK